jgi:hypothetical protein
VDVTRRRSGRDTEAEWTACQKKLLLGQLSAHVAAERSAARDVAGVNEVVLADARVAEHHALINLLTGLSWSGGAES